MINITIISVGDVKEKYLKDMINEYQKRITKYAKIYIVTLKDESNRLQEDIIKEIEGKRIISSIKDGYTILLDLKGEMLDSVSFSKKIDEISTYKNGKINFIIGGSLGVSEDVKNASDYLISFSKMTFPHQLMKAFLLEQIYRAFKILNNETYHK